MLIDYENMRLKPIDNYTLNNATIESVEIRVYIAYLSFECQLSTKYTNFWSH